MRVYVQLQHYLLACITFCQVLLLNGNFLNFNISLAKQLETNSHTFICLPALMPEGDHMNIIDPPGLTVMRIAGGRYRVTGAHRVVWR